MTSFTARHLEAHRTGDERLVGLGRAALVTQGLLYGIVGLLAVELALGDRQAQPSQRGALAAVAREPYGRALLVLLALGLACHALWRATLAVRGEPGENDDGKALAKRAAQAGRALLYASLTVAAVRILAHSGGGQPGTAQKRSTATVLGWPGGRAIVVLVGAAVVAAALVNVWKGATRSFVDDLDLHRLDATKRKAVRAMGTVGFVARGAAFGLIGWFLVQAGLHRDPHQARSLDESLRQLLTKSHGPVLLLLLAAGMVLFGAYRLVDAAFRRAAEMTHA
ncbi:MAG: hypothetical protein JWN46_1010 [Acidimicrobiales bacterium]|nr:hypothetical protein [Acidimicrobiales bacterium]